MYVIRPGENILGQTLRLVRSLSICAHAAAISYFSKRKRERVKKKRERKEEREKKEEEEKRERERETEIF